MFFPFINSVLIAMLSFTSVPDTAAESDANRIIRHKSTLVFRLSTFVTWPEDTFEKKTAPVVIGVLGSNKMSTILAGLTKNESIERRPIKVVSVSTADDWTHLHVMFVDSSAAEAFRTLDDEKIKDLPILTFGDSPTFEKDGGVIRIYMQDTKHKISVNIDAANRKKLHIDYRLLEHADIVHGF